MTTRYPDASMIESYQQMVRSFSDGVDDLTERHAKHVADCKAAGERIDAFLAEHWS